MKKQLNIEGVRSELSGGSAFFPGYKKNDSPAPASVPTPEAVKDAVTTRTPRPTSTPVPPVRVGRDVPLVPLVPPKKRVMKQRHPFDIYHDQYQSLQELALEERKQGGIGSMSSMRRHVLSRPTWWL
jgi:hypothetical protein